MAYDPELADRVTLALDRAGALHVSKKMMGGLCFMVDDKMCLGVLSDRLLVRVGPDAYEACLSLAGCSVMDFTGKPLKGFVYVDSSIVRSNATLDAWVKKALDFNPLAKRSPKRAKKR